MHPALRDLFLTPHTRTIRALRCARSLLLGLCALAWTCAHAGCRQALFPKNEPRTQFENYDRMRNKAAPLEEPDVFGNPQPALRARLSRGA